MALNGLAAEHPQYDEIFESYQRSSDVLDDLPAKSMDGVWEKASAIKSLKDDDEAIAAIARSLARDIMERAHLTYEPKTA